MGFKGTKAEKKVVYDKKVCEYLGSYTKALLASADNVGSKQFQDIRSGLRPDSIVLMGKNTLIKRSIRHYCERTGDETWKALLPLLVGNLGIIFTKGDLKDVREEIAKYKVGAPARVGLVAPIDVIVPPGNTGLDPSQTNFFQVLNIPTKINKGTVEIVAPVDLVKKGEKVGSSEAALLTKLNIRPFSYGLIVQQVYEDGSVFHPSVLDMSEDDLIAKFTTGVQQATALSLGLAIPNMLSLPHIFANCYKNVVAVALECEEYSFPQADKIKEILANPSAFLAAAAAVEAPAGGGAAKEEVKEEAKEEEKEESDEGDFGMGLFD